MILEIKSSFLEYEDFIASFSNDEYFSDPHYMYDKENLYSAIKKENQKIYAVVNNNNIEGLFVWLILPNEKYIEVYQGKKKQ